MASTISLSVVLIVYFIIMLIAALFVYNDAKKRDMNPTGWALIAFFVPFLLGLIIYLICRNPLVDFQCPSCGTGLPVYAKECPKCGHSMLTQCPECEFPVQRGWKTCPKCGNTLPDNYEQPVRTYRKDNSGLVIVGALVGLILLTVLLIVIPFGLFNRVDNYVSEGYGGIEGLYNITKEELSKNEAIASWLEECDKSDKDVHILLSKESETCLVYIKDSKGLMYSDMNLDYYNDEKCNVMINIEEYEYEDHYGYDFFLYEFEMFDNTYVDVWLNGETCENTVDTTDADISINTWGGLENER